MADCPKEDPCNCGCNGGKNIPAITKTQTVMGRTKMARLYKKKTSQYFTAFKNNLISNSK